LLDSLLQELPTFEGSPEDQLGYIDLQYYPAAFKFPHSTSQSKFNSLPNIKSKRRSHYTSALEGIIPPKSETLNNLTMTNEEVKNTETENKTPEPCKDDDAQSKASESTTVVISASDSVCSDSPRGIANEAFEDDEEVDSDCKKGHRRSPSSSMGKDEKACNVSYSSNGSSIEIPIALTKEGLKKQEMAAEYQYIVPNTQLKKGWRGEKLYFTKGTPDRRSQRHARRFCWWMICLLLLAGAITVAALIGVGVIKVPLVTPNDRLTTHTTSPNGQAGPRIGQVRRKDAPQETTEGNMIEIFSPPIVDEEIPMPQAPREMDLSASDKNFMKPFKAVFEDTEDKPSTKSLIELILESRNKDENKVDIVSTSEDIIEDVVSESIDMLISMKSHSDKKNILQTSSEMTSTNGINVEKEKYIDTSMYAVSLITTPVSIYKTTEETHTELNDKTDIENISTASIPTGHTLLEEKQTSTQNHVEEGEELEMFVTTQAVTEQTEIEENHMDTTSIESIEDDHMQKEKKLIETSIKGKTMTTTTEKVVTDTFNMGEDTTEKMYETSTPQENVSKLLTSTNTLEQMTTGKMYKELVEKETNDSEESDISLEDVQELKTTFKPATEFLRTSTEDTLIQISTEQTKDVTLKELANESVTETSGEAEINLDELGSGEEQFDEKLSNEKIQSVVDLFDEEVESSGEIIERKNPNENEIDSEFFLTRETPRKFANTQIESDTELVITLPNMLSGNFKNLLNSDNFDNLDNGSGDDSIELNKPLESITNSETYENGEDVFKALLDLILPNISETAEEVTVTEQSDSSLGELIKHIGSQ